ncbi:MAG: hypothetical protein AAFW87_09255 [Pseudomonadota bacterium]
MKRLSILPVLCLVAACGVDGEPIPPSNEDDETVARDSPLQPRPKVNGAISVGSSGTHVAVGTTFISGNVTVGVGTSF